MSEKGERTSNTKPDNPEQHRHFVEAAREAEADESPGAMDRVFERVNVRQKPKDAKKEKAEKRTQGGR